jgi:hypothetical protein
MSPIELTDEALEGIEDLRDDGSASAALGTNVCLDIHVQPDGTAYVAAATIASTHRAPYGHRTPRS